jgi:hypothetical protein
LRLVGYGFFNGEAEINDFGDAVVIQVEPISAGGDNLSLDIAESWCGSGSRCGGGAKASGKRPRRGSGAPQKCVLFHTLSESLKLPYKEAIADYLLDRWSTPQRDIA